MSVQPQQSANSAEFDLASAWGQALAQIQDAGGGRVSKADLPLVPLWVTRPPAAPKPTNRGQFGDFPDGSGGRPMAGRITPEFPYYTSTNASTAFLDLSQEERDAFMKVALSAGLVTPDRNGQVSPDELFRAWNTATGAAADYNSSRDDKSKWISPWEAAQKLALKNIAGEGGAYDPFKPTTSTSETVNKRDFSKDSQLTNSLESIFAAEMGRAPSAKERAAYAKIVQAAYDQNPETSTTVQNNDGYGNSTSSTVQSGGVDVTGTLLDKIRHTPESDAYQAGSTYFQAAMQALGAIA